MEITCPSCHRQFKFADEKIPPGHKATFKCPACSTKITVGSRQKQSRPQEKLIDFDAVDDEGQGESYDAGDKPFDFIEEEGLTAMICETDPEMLKPVREVLNIMEYHITEVDRARDALKKMRYHTYDVILVNENFDTENPDANGVLIYLERLPMEIRRNIFVAMISNRYRTMDNMMALRHSVNLIINVKNMEDIGIILKRGITENEIFYHIFKETLRDQGQL